jgi:hypothetical protein
LEDRDVQKGENCNEAEEVVFSLYQFCVSVGIVMGYRLDGWGSIPSRIKGIFVYYTAHPTSYPVDTRSSFPRGKARGM